MQLNLEQLAELTGGRLEGPPERVVNGLKGLEQAGPEDVAFLANPKYAHLLPECKAGVVLVTEEQQVPPEMAVIRLESPYLAYAKLLTAAIQTAYEPLGVHERAVVAQSATLGDEVSIHALAVVGENASLGDRVVIHPGAVIGAGCSIGDDTVIHPNAVVYEGCKIGRRCIIHAGVIIGADGFGFVPDGEGHFKIPQIGIVQIDDDVEIGANSTIDRAATGSTHIKRNVKIDNLVMVAHNCEVADGSILVAQVGIAGSTKLGHHVVVGGQSGINGHIKIAERVQIAGHSGVTSSIDEPGAKYAGTPAGPMRAAVRSMNLTRKLPELYERIKRLEEKLGGER